MKKIQLEFPTIDTTLTATLLEKEEPELTELLWKNLAKPVKLFCRHPVSTGQEFSAAARPPRHPVKTGTALNYSVHGGYGGISLYYGPCTEPITVSGAVVAKIQPEDMLNLIKVGETVWNHYYLLHTPITMTARRHS